MKEILDVSGVVEDLDLLTQFKPYKNFEKDFESMMLMADNTCEDISLVMMDIDFFMKINDEYGHNAGDNVLTAIAEHIKKIDNGDFSFYRYGGDCFAILMPGVEKEKAFLLFEKSREALSGKPIKVSVGNSEKTELFVSISAGVATYREDGINVVEMVRKADGAMYRAKMTGRNKVSIARDEKMVTKTSHYTTEQLQRLSELAKEKSIGEAILLREALDDLLKKYDDKKKFYNGKTVLIVDDAAFMRMILSDVVTKKGYKVIRINAASSMTRTVLPL